MINAANKRWHFWLTVSVLLLLFIYLIRGILLPFVLGIFIAYFLHPLTDRLEKKGAPRGIATLLIIIGFFLIITLISLLVTPIIINQLSGLLDALPGYITEFQQHYVPIISHWLGGLPLGSAANIKTAMADMSGVAMKLAGAFVTGLFQSGMTFFHIVSLILITPVVAFYLLRDWDNMVERFYRLIPRSHFDTIREQLAIIDQTLAGFLRGQLNVCLIVGIFYALGLSLVGLKFAILIGLATGALVIFPYIGTFMGFSIGLGVAFFQFSDYESIGLVLAVFVTGQVLEGWYLTPKLVGEKVGLHPVWIIFGMLSGGALFGFVGVLLAVPATAVIGVLIRFALARYLLSNYYQGEPTVMLPPKA